MISAKIINIIIIVDCAVMRVQELENALSCKYVASNAVSALQQVYQLMGSNSREKATSLQSWARILLKPELGRIVEACQLLEQVAIEKVQLGGSYAQAQSKSTAAVLCSMKAAVAAAAKLCASMLSHLTFCCMWSRTVATA